MTIKNKIKKPVRLADGREFESRSACAKVLGESVQWVCFRLKKKYPPFSNSGMKIRGGKKDRKPCFFRGKYYESHAAAAAEYNFCSAAITRSIARGDGRNITIEEYEENKSK